MNKNLEVTRFDLILIIYVSQNEPYLYLFSFVTTSVIFKSSFEKFENIYFILLLLNNFLADLTFFKNNVSNF